MQILSLAEALQRGFALFGGKKVVVLRALDPNDLGILVYGIDAAVGGIPKDGVIHMHRVGRDVYGVAVDIGIPVSTHLAADIGRFAVGQGSRILGQDPIGEGLIGGHGAQAEELCRQKQEQDRA